MAGIPDTLCPIRSGAAGEGERADFGAIAGAVGLGPVADLRSDRAMVLEQHASSRCGGRTRGGRGDGHDTRRVVDRFGDAVTTAPITSAVIAAAVDASKVRM